MITSELLAHKYCFRMTDLRKDILDILIAAEKPMKAYDILKEIRKIRPKAQPPTVYRVLDFLISKGALHRQEKYNTYSLCQLKKNHTHATVDLLIVCSACKKIYEPDSTHALQEHLNLIQKNNSITFSSQILEIECLCNTCIKTKK